MKSAHAFTALLMIALTSFAGLCQARQDPAAVRSEVTRFLRLQTISLPGEVSVQVGEFAPDNALPPCVQLEAFLPPGARAWGRVSVGVRCLGPSSWTVYVPVQVRVTGDYLIAARNLPAGYVLGAGDIVSRSGDLGSLPANIITDEKQAIGKTVKNGFAAGQALRGDLLVAPWAVQQGQTVRTVARGPGFSVSSEGRALNNAAEGQLVQVRTPSGQTVSGVARANGVVEIAQ
jgi:flagella basal body P-ring formation protein FlgA